MIAGLFATSLLSGFYFVLVHPRHVSGSFEGLAHHSAAAIAVACFASVVAAPFAEEIFFRGLLYGGLRNRLPVVPAALIVAVVFGLLHTQYPLLVRPEVAIFGFVACLLYERSRSLLPSMGLHSLHNAVAVTVALRAPGGLVFAAYAALAVLVLATGGHAGATAQVCAWRAFGACPRIAPQRRSWRAETQRPAPPDTRANSHT